MKTIIFVVSFIVLFNIVACDDSGNSGSRCTFDEYREMVANTDCLAEELLFGCSNVGCRGFDPSFQTGFLDDCIVIDCETLSCETLSVGDEPSQPGLLAELTVDEITGFPIGIYQVDDLEGEFACDIMFSN
jgi:hypothetical protein